MASKKLLLLAVAFAVILSITYDVDAAKDLASSHHSAVDDANHFHDDDGYYNGGHGGSGHGGGYNDGPGGYDDGHGGYDDGHHGGYDDGHHGGYHKGGGHKGKDHHHGGCKCCHTDAEATAYKQAPERKTHN